MTNIPLDPRLLERFDFDLVTGEGALVGAGFVGSMSHNTYVPPTDPDTIDDVDILAVVLPPVDHLIGIHSWEHQVIQYEELDAVFYSYHKMIRLLIRANPNVLGLLWLNPEHYLHRTPWFDRLVANRDAFAAKRAIDSHLGYARSQLQKMTAGAFQGYMGQKRRDLVRRYGFDTKNAAHLIRLLLMGIEYAKTGVLRVYRTDDAELLRAIKRGEWSLERVQAYAANLETELEAIKQGDTVLPEAPDLSRINRIVTETVREYVCSS